MEQLRQLTVMHVDELKASMDWENPEWRKRFWAFMGLAALPILKRLDEEGRVPNIAPKEPVRIGLSIKKILNMVERDFGRTSMMHVVGCVIEMLGHSLSPLDTSIIKKLVAEGVEIGEIKKVFCYNR